MRPQLVEWHPRVTLTSPGERCAVGRAIGCGSSCSISACLENQATAPPSARPNGNSFSVNVGFNYVLPTRTAAGTLPYAERSISRSLRRLPGMAARNFADLELGSSDIEYQYRFADNDKVYYSIAYRFASK